MGKGTKDLLINAGCEVLARRGFNHAGLDLIVQMAEVPKGSFYYYFGSKEEFGLAVLDRFAARAAEQFEAHLGDRARGPLERLRGLGLAWLACLESRECRQGCLVGNLCQEMADQSEAFRARLDAIFCDWADRVAACLREAQAAGEIGAGLDPGALAEFWLAGWQGAVLRAKASRSSAPLRTFLDVMFGLVLRN
jgi:TetR/AcrR family transcriptional repressor of nem operon